MFYFLAKGMIGMFVSVFRMLRSDFLFFLYILPVSDSRTATQEYPRIVQTCARFANHGDCEGGDS